MRARVLSAVVSLLVSAPADARVVLVGVDGGSWNLIDPMLARGELPNLRSLLERGVSADLETVEPVNSPTVWTSIATGRSPAAHGITQFYVTRLDVKAPTVWERLAARGLRVGLYDYLVSWPPQAFPGGFSIPDWLRRDDSIAPPDAFARAGVEPYAYSVEGIGAPEEFAANCRRELAEKPERAVRLADAFQLDVAAVTFYAIDACSHRFWDDSFPEQFEPETARPDPRYRELIPEVVRGVDRALGVISGALGPDDSLLVASDHGFQADPAGVRRVWVADVKRWVARAGLDPTRDGFEIGGGFGFVVLRVLPGPFAEREATLERLVELVGSARSPDGDPAYRVEILDVAERPPEVSRPLSAWLRQLAVRAFLWWNGYGFEQPAHGFVFGVPEAETLDPLWPGGSLRLGESVVPIAELLHADDFSGRHEPTGIFLAAGRGIEPRKQRATVSVLEIPALLFYLSDQPIPDDLEGDLRRDLIAPAHLARHAPLQVPASQMPALRADTPGPGPATADDAAIRDRLRSLGYAR